MNDMTIARDLGLAAVAGELSAPRSAVDATTARIDALTRAIDLATARIDDMLARSLGPQPGRPAPLHAFMPPAGSLAVLSASLDRADAAAISLGRAVDQLNRIA